MEKFARTARLAALTGIILYFWIPRSAEALTITCGVSPCETLPSAQAHAKAEAGGGSTDNKLGSPPLPASSEFFWWARNSVSSG
jgi:hypothetical protein